MTIRVTAQLSFSLTLRLALATVVVLVLFFGVFSGPDALARTPYSYSDGSEGDPGDGLLNPRAVEGKDIQVSLPAEQLYHPGYRYVLIPIFTRWGFPGYEMPQFMLTSRSAPGGLVRSGARSWTLPWSGRGWHDAR